MRKMAWSWIGQTLTRIVIVAVLPTACATPPETGGGTVRYVQIRDGVMPQNLDAHVGDEVRWQNLTRESVTMMFLDTKVLKSVSCQKGFNRFGAIDDSATIPPLQFVSLCFAKAGTLRYNVWLDPDDPRGSMSPTATIRIREMGR